MPFGRRSSSDDIYTFNRCQLLSVLIFKEFRTLIEQVVELIRSNLLTIQRRRKLSILMHNILQSNLLIPCLVICFSLFVRPSRFQAIEMETGPSRRQDSGLTGIQNVFGRSYLWYKAIFFAILLFSNYKLQTTRRGSRRRKRRRIPIQEIRTMTINSLNSIKLFSSSLIPLPSSI